MRVGGRLLPRWPYPEPLHQHRCEWVPAGRSVAAWCRARFRAPPGRVTPVPRAARKKEGVRPTIGCLPKWRYFRQKLRPNHSRATSGGCTEVYADGREEEGVKGPSAVQIVAAGERRPTREIERR